MWDTEDDFCIPYKYDTVDNIEYIINANVIEFFGLVFLISKEGKIILSCENPEEFLVFGRFDDYPDVNSAEDFADKLWEVEADNPGELITNAYELSTTIQIKKLDGPVSLDHRAFY
jgi:hypothetical protein